MDMLMRNYNSLPNLEHIFFLYHMIGIGKWHFLKSNFKDQKVNLHQTFRLSCFCFSFILEKNQVLFRNRNDLP